MTSFGIMVISKMLNLTVTKKLPPSMAIYFHDGSCAFLTGSSCKKEFLLSKSSYRFFQHLCNGPGHSWGHKVELSK